MKRVIFWDVDTQNDFMLSSGRLYVPGADSIIPALGKITEFARKKRIPVMGSVDWHTENDPEISADPDFVRTFPAHCIKGDPGSDKISATYPENPLWIEPIALPKGRLASLVKGHKGEIYLKKKYFDVFTNPNTTTLIDITEPDLIFIYGVATDVCVAHAVEGFLSFSTARLFIIRDAVKALDPKKEEELFFQWKDQGVKIIETSDLFEMGSDL